MSLSTMTAEMRGCVPNYSAGLARIHLRNAWTDIKNLKGWSFQLGNTGYTVPGLINAGKVTTTLGSDQVTGDATASAAWIAGGNATSLITQRQFRTGQGTIYNIVALDDTDPNAVILTLDRPWIDAYYLGAAQGYQIYQPYIVAPAKSFQAWEYFMDVRNVIHLDVNNTRGCWEQINESDPQRQIFSNPGNLIPHGTDTRAGSATYGWSMFELYPQPQSIYVYQVGYSWGGPDLTDDPAMDAVPAPMTEHVVKTLARLKAYEWAEANKTADNPRGAGADYRFLMQAAKAEYDAQIKEIRSLDRDIYDAWNRQMQRFTNIGVVATFNPATGTVASRNM
jgi:hypothetical protein